MVYRRSENEIKMISKSCQIVADTIDMLTEFVVPGVLILEAMAQASGILGFKTMSKTPDEGSMYYFVGADNLRFKRPVIPGDKLILESTKISDKRGIWKFECKASVEDEFVCSATILCADRPK